MLILPGLAITYLRVVLSKCGAECFTELVVSCTSNLLPFNSSSVSNRVPQFLLGKKICIQNRLRNWIIYVDRNDLSKIFRPFYFNYISLCVETSSSRLPWCLLKAAPFKCFFGVQLSKFRYLLGEMKDTLVWSPVCHRTPAPTRHTHSHTQGQLC